MTARLITIEASKTFATEANVVKAVEKCIGIPDSVRYFIMQTKDGRFFPVFIGQEAIQNCVHFKFNVVA